MNDIEINGLIELSKQTALNVSSISKQMGIISTEIQELKIEQRRQAEKMKRIDDRMQNYEDRIRLTRPQANNVRQSIHARVRDLLGIEYENGIVKKECLFADKYLRPGFISRCYTDARRESKLGTPYSETYQRDYSEVLRFIATWEPPTGTDGYTAYLLNRKKS